MQEKAPKMMLFQLKVESLRFKGNKKEPCWALILVTRVGLIIFSPTN